jgi:hypothetical protein
MLFVGTAIGIAYALGKFLGGEEAFSFHYPALAVQPSGFNRVEPGAFRREIARQYPHFVTPSLVLDLVVVLFDPLTNLFADVPGGVVPHHHKYPLASLPQLTAAPFRARDICSLPGGDNPRGQARWEPLLAWCPHYLDVLRCPSFTRDCTTHIRGRRIIFETAGHFAGRVLLRAFSGRGSCRSIEALIGRGWGLDEGVKRMGGSSDFRFQLF